MKFDVNSKNLFQGKLYPTSPHDLQSVLWFEKVISFLFTKSVLNPRDFSIFLSAR